MQPIPLRTWLILLGINVLVSALTTVVLLQLLGTPRIALPAVPPTPGSGAVQPAPTQPATGVPATPTRAAPSAGKVRIANINNVGQRQREQVVIVNAGDLVDLKSWTLSNGRAISYTFLNVALTKDTFVNVYTTEGSDAAGNLFWNRPDAAWQVGDLVSLRDADGMKVDDFVIR